jgi:predicted phage-related endonuclease
MQIHDLIQGSPEWMQFRLEHYGASEAAAMLGLSTKVTRNELLHMKKTGTAQEFSDWVREHILDHGHEVEALARPLAENMAGTEFYPVTCSAGPLSASCDGLTMAEDLAFEHKQWNAALADSVAAGVLPDEYQPQCQQIMMVTPAERVLFVCSDGTLDNFVHMYVEPDPAWQARISAGWDQFWADEAVYEHKTFAPKPAAEPIMHLPALAIQIRGEVMVSNLPTFKAKAEAFIKGINTELKTDEDFVNADATVKFCGETEKNLELAKSAAIAQTASIDEVMRTVDLIIEQIRAKRLMLEKLIESQKKAIKESILTDVKKKFADHVAAVDAELAPLRLVFQARDFAGAIKNKRTLATLHNAVDTELAAGKIAVDALARDMRGRLAWYRENAAGHEFLFADLQTVIQKADDDFKLLVNSRIDAHKVAVAAKLEADRVRIQAEADAAAELKAAQANPAGADLSPAAQELNEQQGATRFAAAHPTLQGRPLPMAWPPTTPTTPPTLRLGQINERIAPLSISVEGLRTLGFEPAARDKAAQLYHEHQFPGICAAMIRHIGAIQAKQAA